jgi:hypothetical protein
LRCHLSFFFGKMIFELIWALICTVERLNAKLSVLWRGNVLRTNNSYKIIIWVCVLLCSKHDYKKKVYTFFKCEYIIS